jgi:hypothetical protein
LAIVFFGNFGYSQRTYQSDSLLTIRPKNGIRFNAGALVNFIPAIQFGYERRLGRNIALTADVGYIFNTRNSLYLGNGYRVKLGVQSTFSNIGLYGLEVVRRSVYRPTSDFFDLGTHEQRFDYERIKTLTYAAGKIGLELPMVENKLYIELTSSIGYGVFEVEDRGKPDFEESNFNRFFTLRPFENEGVTPIPVIACSMNLKYLFD